MKIKVKNGKLTNKQIENIIVDESTVLYAVKLESDEYTERKGITRLPEKEKHLILWMMKHAKNSIKGYIWERNYIYTPIDVYSFTTDIELITA